MSTPAARRASLADVGWLCAALATVFAGLWCLGWRLRVLVSTWSDARAYFLPKYQHAAERIAAGEFPLWNPFEFGGIPFLATVQPGVFYPPARLIMAMLSGDDAHLALFGFHLLAGAVGALWLAREFGLGRGAAVLAALWVTQPSWLVRIFDNPVFSAGVTWVPYLLVLGRRAVLRPSPRTAAVLAVVAAMQVTSGYPPLVLAAAYLVALVILASLVEMRPRTARRLARTLATLGAAGVLAGLLAAVQILPTAELIRETSRQADASTVQESMTQLDPEFGGLINVPPPDVRTAVDEAWHRYGPALLGLAVLGLVLGGARPGTWFAVAAVVLATLVPLPAYRHLPLFGFVRFGFEWTSVAPLVVYFAAALGLDAVLRRAHASRSLAAGAVLAVAGFAAAWGWHYAPARLLPAGTLEPLAVPAWAYRLCDLHDQRYRSFWPKGQASAALFHAHVASIAGYEQSLLPARSAELVRQLGIGNPYVDRRWAEHLADAHAVTVRMGLRCVLSTSAAPLERVGFRMVDDPEGGRAYVDDAALPRARLAYTTRWAAGGEEAAAALRVTEPATVILEGSPPAPAPACAPDAADGAVIASDRPEDVRVAVTTRCPAHLVLADSWFPGWTATVDGTPAPILRADYAFRAVAVPAGRHEVRFVYAPRSMRAGTALSLLGLVVTLGLFVYAPRGRAANR